jgi:molybdopterin converting factor small subunit
MRAERDIAAVGVSVTLPPALLALFPGAPMVQTLPAADVVALLAALDARWPGMRDRLADSRPAIRRHIQLFVDGQRAGLETPLRPGADVVFLTAVSGG